jgi:putative ABC transport system permease protein
MLGIIIGVVAVIAVVAIGQGAQAQVDAQISSLGTNVLLIFPGSMTSGGARGGAASGTTLTEDDGEAIKEQCPAVMYVSPQLRSGGQAVYGDVNWATSMQGGSPDYFEIRDWRIDKGEFFADADVRGATKVCVLGQTVMQQLFGDEDPINKTIRIRSIPFRVVGTMKPKGQNMMGQDQDDIVLVPYTTLQKRMVGNTRSWGFLASARVKTDMAQAQQEITDLLRSRHKLGPMDDNDFTIRSQTDIAQASADSSRTMNILLIAIASVSLMVGGIGIMNIMLVSVTERTREIGVRMSIGARKSDILTQFLMEAIVMSMLGGFIGVILGISGSSLISKFVGWPTFISSNSIVLAVCFSMIVGVFFGFYPARKASLLSPIEALRYE